MTTIERTLLGAAWVTLAVSTIVILTSAPRQAERPLLILIGLVSLVAWEIADSYRRTHHANPPNRPPASVPLRNVLAVTLATILSGAVILWAGENVEGHWALRPLAVLTLSLLAVTSSRSPLSGKRQA